MKFTSIIAIYGFGASALARGHTKRSGSNNVGAGVANPIKDAPRPKIGNVPYGKIIYECTKPGVVAITFDDGPSKMTDQLLDILAEAGAKATFFLTGVNIELHRAVVARAHREGHQLAQHSWSHKDLSATSKKERWDEIIRPEAAFAKVLGFFPTYMRPPYGECNAECEDHLGDLGYHVINWNIDSNDWRGNMVLSEQIINTELTQEIRGPIVLAHDMEATIKVLAGHIITVAKAHGLKMVTIGECLGDDPSNWYRAAPRPHLIIGLRSKLPLLSPTNRTGWNKSLRLLVYRNIESKNRVDSGPAADAGWKEFMSASAKAPELLEHAATADFLAREIGATLFSYMIPSDKEPVPTVPS
ncbi:hypothetical protein PspLS_12024 [Pyricularia sp. CBS 133598]|nr:hypothetical protein PspLS_12024 [Pyricularia sp. CBS 133598]